MANRQPRHNAIGNDGHRQLMRVGVATARHAMSQKMAGVIACRNRRDAARSCWWRCFLRPGQRLQRPVQRSSMPQRFARHACESAEDAPVVEGERASFTPPSATTQR